MKVNSLFTENFRLLESQKIEFSPNVNVIVGNNAQGKTSLLEAVYLLTGVKSFRTRYDKELIAFGKDYAKIESLIQVNENDVHIDIDFFQRKPRVIRKNDVKISGTELNENLKAVLFSPDDLNLIRGSSANRRKMMDTAISQLRPGYISLLNDFNKVYENKSRILKDWREKPSLLEPLDEFNAALTGLSTKIIRYRASFLDKLSASAGVIHKEFSGNLEDLRLSYMTVSTVTNPLASEAEIYQQISQRQQELRTAEIESGLCLVGAHKDDISFFINDIEAKAFASQGQVRTAALSVKLAERDLFISDTGENPVLLLDDVLSELDNSRQEFVLNRIDGGQTLITCCDDAVISRLIGGKLLRLDRGKVF